MPLLVSLVFTLLFFLALLLFRSPALMSEDANSLTQNSVSTTSLPKPLVPSFVDRTIEMGLFFEHRQGDTPLSGLSESFGGGGCLLDYDGDGWTDLFLVNGTGESRYYGKPYWWQREVRHTLYRNVRGLHFEDVTDQAGLSIPDWGMTCAAADLDNDGDDDLLIAALGVNKLYRNNGDGTFSDVSEAAGLVGNAWSTDIAVVDFDLDGLLDIYITNFISYQKNALIYEAANPFLRVQDPEFDSRRFPPQANQLLRNMGNLVFTSLAKATGTDNTEGRSTAAAWLQVNSDEYPDLLVANAAGDGANKLFISTGDGSFHDATLDLKAGANTGFFGTSAADLDGDGHMEAVLSGFGTEALAIYQVQQNDGPVLIDKARDWGIRNETLAGLHLWSPTLADLNNDGRVDLFLPAGGIHPDPDSPRVPVGQPNRLLLNLGGSFRDVSGRSGLARWSQSSRDALAFDWDRDGDQDLLVINNNDFVQFLENTSIVVDAPREKEIIGNDVSAAVVEQVNQCNINELEIGEDESPVAVFRELFDQFGVKPFETQIQASLLTGLPLSRSELAVALHRIGGEAAFSHLLMLANASYSMDDVDTLVSAIEGLCWHENEILSRWLLDYLRHPMARVRQVTAQCYAALFHEEEAMVHRKYLAVPALIRLLDDSEPEVRIAAIRALGESERYRALEPLVDVLLAGPAGHAEAGAAALALGELREGEAMSALQKALFRSDASAEYYSRVLRAIRRIDRAAGDQALTSFVSSESGEDVLPVAMRLSVVGELFNAMEQRASFPTHFLLQTLRTQLDQSEGWNSDARRTFVKVLDESGLPESRELLSEVFNFPNWFDVETDVLKGLSSAQLLANANTLRQVLLRCPQSGCETLLARALKAGWRPTEETIERLWVTPVYRVPLLAYGRGRTLSAERSRVLGDVDAAATLKSATLSGFAMNGFSEELTFAGVLPFINSTDSRLRRAALATLPVFSETEKDVENVFRAVLSDTNSSDKAWLLQQLIAWDLPMTPRLVARVVLDTQQPTALRIELLNLALRDMHRFDPTLWLQGIARRSDDPARSAALTVLMEMEQALPRASMPMRQVTQDISLPMLVRLKAGRLLQQEFGKLPALANYCGVAGG